MTTPPDFDAVYGADADPWDVESSWYERRKLAVLLASLPRERYERAWEPGCGIGVGTAALAARCDELVASDLADEAVAQTRRRTNGQPHVHVERSTLPEVPLDGHVDLVVLAEFLYYLPDLEAALASVWSVCRPGAHVVVEHWAHSPHDGFLDGPETHEHVASFAAARGARRLVSHRDTDFLLDVFEVPS